MRWFLRHIPQDNPELIARARLLVIFALGTGVASIVFVPVFRYLGSAASAVFAGLVAPFIVVSALVLRMTGSVTVAATYYLLSVWVFITGVALLSGGVQSPGLPAFSVLILAATFLVGRRSGVFWSLVCMGTVVIVELAQWWWISVELQPRAQMATLSVLGLATVLGLVGIFALRYDSEKTRTLRELRRVGDKVTRMIGSLEQASNRLVRSSEQFLGSAIPARDGLVHQMMSTAREGRHTMEEARTSIEGMIDQYQRIAHRVQTLARHSHAILDLVSTIDRISNRLDLMALNVGIEAAQTSEGGTQFTILARDMRGLAERVVVETQRIKTSLRGVHEQVRGVLESSASGQGLTEDSARKMQVMVNTFDEMFSLLEQTETATGMMTTDTLAQIDAVRELVIAAGRRE